MNPEDHVLETIDDEGEKMIFLYRQAGGRTTKNVNEKPACY